MAINPLQQPIQYGVEPQDPSRALLEGLQIGGAFRQRRQMREQEQLAEQYKADASAYYANPTPQGALELARKYPEQGAALMQDYRALGAEQRKGEATRVARVAAALGAGRQDIAKKLVSDEILAVNEAGGDATNFELINAAIEKDPNAAYGPILQILTMMDSKLAEDLASTLEKTGALGEQGDQYRFLTPEEIAANPNLDPSRAYQKDLKTGKVSSVGGGGTTINMPAEPPKLGKTPENWYNNYLSAVNQNADLERLEKDVEKSLAGTLAEERVELLRLAELFGVASDDAKQTLEATQKVTRGLAESALQARALIAGQGQGTITDAEQQLLLKARGGSINFTKGELITLFGVIKKINERAAPQMAKRIRAAAKRGSAEAQVFADLLDEEAAAPPPAAGDAKPPTPTNVEVDY
jgi:chemotaxis protein histidine kinase CheA